MKATSLLSLLLLPALVPLLPAQAPDHLVGITRFQPALRHHSHPACGPIGQCPLPMPNSAALPQWAGGTAWNPVRSGAWVTNGQLLAQFDDGCNLQCPPMPIPTLAPGNVVTGLELVEGLNELWMIDSGGFLHRYTNTCPAAPIGVCPTGLAVTAIGNATTGLAVDEANGLVFISYSTFPAGLTRIVVTNIANPCAIVSQFPWPACALVAGQPVLGLACDWGSGFLYGTDGFNTTRVNYLWAAPNVLITGVNCCPAIAVGNDPMIGLAVRPGRATPVGQPCANGTCAPCPQIHTLRNDPSLGNAAFALGLDQVPSGAISILTVGAGPCGPGVLLPPLCGPLFTFPLLGTIGPNLTGGGMTPCDGSTTFNIPLPVAPGLAGLVYSSQAVTLCFGGGWALSNCLSWQLQGN